MSQANRWLPPRPVPPFPWKQLSYQLQEESSVCLARTVDGWVQMADRPPTSPTQAAMATSRTGSQTEKGRSRGPPRGAPTSPLKIDPFWPGLAWSGLAWLYRISCSWS